VKQRTIAVNSVINWSFFLLYHVTLMVSGEYIGNWRRTKY